MGRAEEKLAALTKPRQGNRRVNSTPRDWRVDSVTGDLVPEPDPQTETPRRPRVSATTSVPTASHVYD